MDFWIENSFENPGKDGFVLQMYDALGRPAICINR